MATMKAYSVYYHHHWLASYFTYFFCNCTVNGNKLAIWPYKSFALALQQGFDDGGGGSSNNSAEQFAMQFPYYFTASKRI